MVCAVGGVDDHGSAVQLRTLRLEYAQQIADDRNRQRVGQVGDQVRPSRGAIVSNSSSVTCWIRLRSCATRRAEKTPAVARRSLACRGGAALMALFVYGHSFFSL